MMTVKKVITIIISSLALYLHIVFAPVNVAAIVKSLPNVLDVLIVDKKPSDTHRAICQYSTGNIEIT